RVSGLRRVVIDRLREIGTEELDALGTVVELGADSSGILRNRQATANLEPDKGARIGNDTVQLGLSRKEIRRVQDRLEQLLADVDTGKIPTF
ncbi:MAG: hypothetical protein VCE43_07210, partial [Myxococcota bacterium]